LVISTTNTIAAAEAGAQIIAVIRSTGQSLLDFVPYGPTTEGFGGTYATQANFQIMREALDDVSERLGRYVMLTNYASGLCMPEIAVIAALERLGARVVSGTACLLVAGEALQVGGSDERYDVELRALDDMATFVTVRIDAMTDALRRLQESADVIVVRHRSGAREVLF